MGDGVANASSAGMGVSDASGLRSRGERWLPARPSAGAPGLDPGAPVSTPVAARCRAVADRARTRVRGESMPRARAIGPPPRSLLMLALPLAVVRSPAPRATRGAPGARRRCRRSRASSVVGSGPLAWGKVAVRSAPSRDARGRHDARAVPARLPPAHRARPRRAAGRTRRSRRGTGSRSRDGRTAARAGSRAAAAEVDAGRPLARDLPRLAEVRALRRRHACGGRALSRSARGAWRRRSGSSTSSRASCRARYPILGAFAFETSGYSKLSDWPGGGVVGVHGTNTPWLIGQAVSHGCVRLRNSDILALRKLVRVGTPVKIVAA